MQFFNEFDGNSCKTGGVFFRVTINVFVLVNRRKFLKGFLLLKLAFHG